MRFRFSTCSLSKVFLPLVGLFGVTFSVPLYVNQTACAVVSSSVQAFFQASPSATPTISAELAYACANSVPLHTSQAQALVSALIPYINWQTTIAYLKDPPSGYQEAATDIFGTLDTISQNLTNGVYQNEYEFGDAVYRLFTSAHDGHFSFIPDIVGKVFTFGRAVPLVSVSANATALPQVYVFDDIHASYNISLASNSTTTKGVLPSSVTEIDGQEVNIYLEDLKQRGVLQDPDALWNNLFWNPAQIALGSAGTGTGVFGGGGRGRYVYPGATTTLTFANGTKTSYPNFANVLYSFDGVTDGESFYQKFCTGPPATATASATATATANTTTSAIVAASTTASSSSNLYTATPGYPVPVIRHPENWIAGYYLNFSGYSDIAVLSVPSFVGDITPVIEQEFQSVAQNFLAESKAAGKTKLIVDLSANSGGTILAGYDLFKQLFPSIVPFGETRFRAHESFNIIGEQISALAAAYPANQSDTEIAIAGDNPFNYREDLTTLLMQDQSWAEVYGPHEFYGDNFTSIIRYNLSDPLQTVNPISGVGIVVTGYLNRTNFSQPYAAKDVIMLYDGYCASTCTIFSEFMRTQVGIQSIAMGGRPQYGEIQAIGGVKGANDYPFSYIWELAGEVYDSGTPAQQAYWNTTELVQISSIPLNRADSPDNPKVNARDNILPGDTDQIPAQFIYEAADCRIFYTPEMIVDVTTMWRTVADSTWGNATSSCIAGSLRGKSLTS